MKKLITSIVLLLGLCFYLKAQTVLPSYQGWDSKKYTLSFSPQFVINNANGTFSIAPPIPAFVVSGNIGYAATNLSIGIGTTNPTAKFQTNGTLRHTVQAADSSKYRKVITIDATALAPGAATLAGQTTGNNSIASIDTKLTTTANGLKIDGSGVTQPVSLAGVATAANQATEINSLATIATNTAGASTAALQTAGNNLLATLASASGPATAATFTQYSLTANTAQTIAASTGRKSIKIAPTNGVIFINVGSAATASNYVYRVSPGYTYECVPVDGTTLVSVNNISGAGVHPTDAGNVEYKNNVNPIISW